MSKSVGELVLQAGRAANEGRWEDAERLWQELHRRKPDDPRAMFGLGVHAMQRGDFTSAASRLEAACKATPQDALAWLSLAAARRHMNDPAGEGEAIQSALACDPYFLPAMLAKGGWLERTGDATNAAVIYRAALRTAPPESEWPEALRAQFRHARDMAQRYGQAFAAHLAAAVKDLHAYLPTSIAQRWREAAAIMAGLSEPFFAHGLQAHIPRLPAIPFYEHEEFADAFHWAPALEAKTDAIRAELNAELASNRDAFTPYVAYKPGEPVNQWGELNASKRWSAYQLYRNGQPIDAQLARCPQTAAVLKAIDLAEIDGLCPNAMFSALAPKTRIPPHRGETNARVVVHLPLIVPEGCRYRVGFEERRWEVGKILVFDDTIEHEAHNDGNDERVVLIFDIWNPLLLPAEREIVKAMMAARRIFR